LSCGGLIPILRVSFFVFINTLQLVTEQRNYCIVTINQSITSRDLETTNVAKSPSITLRLQVCLKENFDFGLIFSV